MQGAEWILEAALVLLLGATLFHALRLERALGVLKRDRAVLEELVEGFNESTRQAETGIERLRSAADGAGRQMARQIESAQRLRDDLSFLSDRSDKLAERLESAVRAARMVADSGVLPGHLAAPPAHPPPQHVAAQPRPSQPVASQPLPSQFGPSPPAAAQPAAAVPATVAQAAPRTPVALVAERQIDAEPRLRSQAERDLLRALRGVR